MNDTSKLKRFYNLRVRMAKSERVDLDRRTRKAGLNPKRDLARYVIGLLKACKMRFSSEADMEEVKRHFTKFAELGTRLNRVVHEMNINRLRCLEGEIDEIPVNGKELRDVLLDLKRELAASKQALLKLSEVSELSPDQPAQSEPKE